LTAGMIGLGLGVSVSVSVRCGCGAGLIGGKQREREVFGGGGAAARGFFECRVAAGRVHRLFAVENLLDGEDLQAGIGCAVEGSAFVEACPGGFAQYGLCGLAKS